MNSQSIIHNYKDIQPYTPPFELLQTGLAFKQGKYDANISKIDGAIEQYASLDVAKDVQREYINDRLQSLVEIADRYSNEDFSSDGLTRSMVNNLGQVMDENVMNAITDTRILRSRQKEWETARKKNDGSYNNANYEYSMQPVNEWISDGKLDTRINGGEFINYSDYRKKLSGNSEKFAAHGVKFIQEGENNGYFREIATGEKADPVKLRSILNAVLDQGDIVQMKIDGWDRYRGLDEDVLKSDFNDYFADKNTQYQEQISKYEKLRDAATNQDDKKKYQLYIDDKKSAITQNSYDEFSKKYGRSGAELMLHKRQTIDGFVDGYSYSEINDIKVRDIDKQTRDYQHKLAELDLSKAKFANQQFNQEENRRLKELELGLKYKVDINNLGASPTSTSGNALEIDPEKQSDLVEKAVSDQIVKANEGMRKLIESKVGHSISDNQMVQLAGQLDDLSEKDELTFKMDGKSITIPLTGGNMKTALDFKNNVLGDSPIVKKQSQLIMGIVNNIQNEFGKVAVGGDADLNLATLPKMGIKFVSNGDGTYRTAEVKEGADKNYHAYLIKKKQSTPLSQEEQLTLDYYVMTQMMLDPATNDSKRKAIVQTIRTNVVSKLDTKTIQSGKIPDNVKGYAKMQLGDRKQNMLSFTDYNFSSFTSGDMTSDNYTSKVRESVLEDGYAKFDTEMERDVKATNFEMSQTSNIFTKTKNPKDYDALRSLLGLPASFKNDIEIAQDIDPETGEGETTVSYRYTTGEGKNMKTVVSKGNRFQGNGNSGKIEEVGNTLSTKTLAEKGLKFGSTKRDTYLATAGDKNPPIQLGSTSRAFNDESMTTASKYRSKLGIDVFRESMPITSNNLQPLYEYAKESGIEENIRGIVDRYKAGEYTFRLEGNENNGLFHMNIYKKDGTRLKSLPTQYSSLDSEDVANYMQNAQYHSEIAFMQYLGEYIRLNAKN